MVEQTLTLAEMSLIGVRCIEKRAFHALVMFLLATANVQTHKFTS